LTPSGIQVDCRRSSAVLTDLSCLHLFPIMTFNHQSLLISEVSAYFANFVCRLAETFFPHCQCTLDDKMDQPRVPIVSQRAFPPCPTGRCRWRCGSSVNHRTSGSRSHRTRAGSQEDQVVHVPHDCSGGRCVAMVPITCDK
jgi:hypothetical protein